jgi:hypothetical protein
MADFEFDVEPLRSLAQAGERAAYGLPPDTVRRLGMRRRKRRLAVAASVAVVTAIALAGGAAGVVAYVGSSNLGPARPAPLPEMTTVITDPSLPTPALDVPSSVDLPGGVIPADFPIDVDLPDYGGDGITEGPDLGYWYREISPCADESLPNEIATALVDATSVRLLAPEVEVFRGLWVFESVADAESVLAAYIDDVRACPTVTPTVTGDETMISFTVDRLDLGDESYLTVQDTARWPDEGPLPGLSQSALVRLGPAVLIVSDYGEGMRGRESDKLQRQYVLDTAETLTAATCELIDRC